MLFCTSYNFTFVRAAELVGYHHLLLKTAKIVMKPTVFETKKTACYMKSTVKFMQDLDFLKVACSFLIERTSHSLEIVINIKCQ